MNKKNFNQHAKTELLSSIPDTDCCKIAWLASAIKAIGSLNLERNGISLVFESDSLEYIQTVIACIKGVYFTNLEANVVKGKSGIKDAKIFSVKVPYGHTKTILKDTDIMNEYGNGLSKFKSGISVKVVQTECCAKSFLKSLFIATGNANVPSKIIGVDDDIISSGKDYYLEFALQDKPFAEDLIKLLENLSIFAKLTERKGRYIVYVKESEAISNFFAFLNANETVLYMQDIIVERLVNNNLNRKSNCEVANIDKIAIASTRQIIAIKKIDELMGLDKLTDKLKEIALLRLEYPTATLDFFVEKLNNEVSKSGINHRFRRLIAIADKLTNLDKTGQED